MPYITLQEEIYVGAEEWFDDAYEDERKLMFQIAQEHFKGEQPAEPATIQEAEFRDKLQDLQNRYLSLTNEQIQLILSI